MLLVCFAQVLKEDNQLSVPSMLRKFKAASMVVHTNTGAITVVDMIADFIR